MNNRVYGIIGNGSIAKHFLYYLGQLNVPYIQWSRKKDSISPEEKLAKCNTILLLISDDSIENFITNHSDLNKKTLIHFSGSLITKKAIGFHPLMSFSEELYDLEKYKSIPFIGIKTSKDFSHYFPMLKNRYFVIDENQKQLYHALCVLSGNLTTLLWIKATKEFESNLNLPKELLYPYLNQICLNITKGPPKALTGPIKRQDIKTMKSNRKALNSKIWGNIYRLFNKAYKEELK